MTGFNTIVRHLEQLRLYLDRLVELAIELQHAVGFRNVIVHQ